MMQGLVSTQDVMREGGSCVEYQLPGVFCRNPVIRCKAGGCERPHVKRMVREWKADITYRASTKKRKTDAAIAHSQGRMERCAGSSVLPSGCVDDSRMRDRVSESSGTDESWGSGRDVMGEAQGGCDSSPPHPDSQICLSGTTAQHSAGISLSSLATAQNSTTPSLSSLATAEHSNPLSLSALATAQNSTTPSLSSLATTEHSNTLSLSALATAQNSTTPSLSSLATAHSNFPPSLSALATAQNSNALSLSALTTSPNSTTPGLASLATPQDTDNALSLTTATQLQITIPKLKIPATTTSSRRNTASLPTLPVTTASPLTLPNTTAGPSLSSLAAAHLHIVDTSVTVAPLVITPLTVPPLNNATQPHLTDETEEECNVMERVEGDMNATIDLQSALVIHEKKEKEDGVKTDAFGRPILQPPVIEHPWQPPHDLSLLKPVPSPFGEVMADPPVTSLTDQRLLEHTIQVPFSVFAFDTLSPDEEVQQAINDPRNPSRYKLIMQERQSRIR